MHWNGMNGSMGWGWIFVTLVVIGFVLLIVVLVRLVGRGGQQPPHTGGQRSRALEILDERYARGEIDATEYDERRNRLDIGDRT